MRTGVRHIITEAHDLGDPKSHPPVDMKTFYAAFTAMQSKYGLEIEKMVREYHKLVMKRYETDSLLCLIEFTLLDRD